MKKAAPGQLALARKAGFNTKSLLPIAPPTARLSGSGPGKVPASFDGRDWKPLSGWENGAHPSVQDEADMEGCNVGLVLGRPDLGHNFLVIDIDTEPHKTDDLAPESLIAWGIVATMCNAVIRFAKANQLEGQHSIWMRRGRPGRSAVLVSLPLDTPAGHKNKIHLADKRGKNLGALEILATGQQAVIGGMHPVRDGTPTYWTNLGDGGSQAKYPAISNGCLQFNSRGQIDEFIKYALMQLEEHNSVVVSKQKTTSLVKNLEVQDPISLSQQAAWDVQSFVELLAELPHNADIERDEYVEVMLACAGCINAMRKLGRITDDAEIRMVDAAIAWACKWESASGETTSEYQERIKWQSDFSRRPINYLGWEYLLNKGVEHGNDRLRTAYAQLDFEPESDAPVSITFAAAHEIFKPSEGVPALRRKGRQKFDTKSSDIQMADFVQDRLGDSIAWVADRKQWIAWGGMLNGGWSTPNADNVVKMRIEDQLVFYVERFEEVFGSNEGMKAKLTSQSRVAAIEKLLQNRLATLPGSVNATKQTLQTPTFMMDLKTGQRLTWEDQRRALEQRCTSVSPASGPCPLFSSIVRHLACYDDEVERWLWAYAGYALLGNPTEHVVLIISGPGENGKSRFASVLRRLFGDYARQIDRRVLTAAGKNDHPTGLNDIKGRRLWCVSEFQEDEQWNEAQLKALSGGDPINARAMNKDMDQITAEGAFLIYTNFVPSLQRISSAIVRRLRILNSRLPVSAESKDPHIEDKIMTTEAPAILQRLIEEAKAVADRGGKLPPTPAPMLAETSRYFAAQDNFHGWFSSQCEVVLETRAVPLLVDELYGRYCNYMRRAAELNKLVGSKKVVDLMDEESEGLESNVLSVSGFVSALRRAGVLVDVETVEIPVKAAANSNGAHAEKRYERQRVAKGVKLRISEVR